MTIDLSDLFPQLASYVAAIRADQEPIRKERRLSLEQLARSVQACGRSGEPAKVTFICTHNSRRSQLAQIWAQTAAHIYGVVRFEAFSGGTEVTAFNPRAVATLRRAGFSIEVSKAGMNPLYAVRFSRHAEPMNCFSKIFDQPPNPSGGFTAVMTCSAADAACPVVLGASERINIRYDDPKAFDGTDREAMMYDERSRQIAHEMLYAFSLAASSNPESTVSPGH